MNTAKRKKCGSFFVSVLTGFILLSSFSSRANQTNVTSETAIDSLYKLAKVEFENYAQGVYQALGDTSLNYHAFKCGLTGYMNMVKRDELNKPDILTVIDFSKPSNEERFYLIDLCSRKIIFRTLVAHGVNSGGLYARNFSNETNSHQSSLGFYRTTSTYTGKYDLALRLDGMEYSNSHASSRGIVVHAAKYATYEYMQQNGCTLGRSYGCPALPFDNFDKVIETIKEGTCFFIYYPNRSYLRNSKYLNRPNYLEDFIPDNMCLLNN